MKRHNLQDFLRKDAQRKASKNVDENVYRVSSTNKPMVPTVYQLPVKQREQLASFANPDCWQCHGTGVKGWRNSGMVAEICRCVKRSLEERSVALAKAQELLEKRLAEQGKDVEAEVAEAKEVVKP